jgi:hypothetical protein
LLDGCGTDAAGCRGALWWLGQLFGGFLRGGELFVSGILG